MAVSNLLIMDVEGEEAFFEVLGQVEEEEFAEMDKLDT